MDQINFGLAALMLAVIVQLATAGPALFWFLWLVRLGMISTALNVLFGPDAAPLPNP